MCELLDVIGDSGFAYCTIPEADRVGETCDKCKLKKLGLVESLAEEIIKLQARVSELEQKQKIVDCFTVRATMLKDNIEEFVNSCIKFNGAESSFEKVNDVYDCYLKYYDFEKFDIGREALTRNMFCRHLRRFYGLNIKQIKIKGKIFICILYISLKGR